MTAVLPHESTDRPAPTATAQPHLYPATQLLTITTHSAPPTATVLAVHGEVDMLTSTQMEDRLLPLVRGTVPRVIVDLTGVGFFGVAGLTVLVNAREAAVVAGVTLSLVASTRPVLLPLTITGLDDLFDISPDLTDALVRAGCGPDG